MTAEDYVRRVSVELGDLPWRQRRDLVSELRAHLAELPAETDLAERLGAPERYAADLRAAAGLERHRGPIAFIRARRPRNVVLTVLVLTLLGLAIGAVAWIDSYQPLTIGNGTQYPPNTKPTIGSDIQHVEFREGRPFDVGVSVVNNGRFTVRVLGVEDSPGLSFSVLPLSGRRLVMAGPEPNHGGFSGPFRRFRPFDLAPGQLALLVLHGSYDARCHAANGQSFWEVGGFELRFRFLWRTGTAEIPVSPQLQIDGPKGMLCAVRP